jgi:hypothetical protein
VEAIEQGRLSHYLVELRPSRLGWSELETLTARARDSAAELRRAGSDVRFLRAVFVPEDETCFFLYEGESQLVVREAAGRAGLELEEFVEKLTATASASLAVVVAQKEDR